MKGHTTALQRLPGSGRRVKRSGSILRANEHPYIDVTTYTKRGNFIGQFVGWSRFEDGPKPIIGMNGKTWLCLHECPAGERPGLITDMKAWTRKHGYPMPIPPEYQPEYPNRNYQDDIDVCMEK
jgi:hypothetical protein